MAEKQRAGISNFHGSVVTRVQPHLVKDPDCIEMVNIDPSTGSLVPLKQDAVEDLTVKKAFFRYSDEWISSNIPAEYLTYESKLYVLDGQQGRKVYTYLGQVYDEKLGIDKPAGTEATDSFYYGHVNQVDKNYIDAFFIEPYLIGLRGATNGTATAGTYIDVYAFTEAGVELKKSATLSSAFGTKLFCHIIDSQTIGIFLLGSSEIKIYKYYISSDTFIAGTSITPVSGETFLCMTGRHDSADSGQWTKVSDSAVGGGRWDSGWIMASSALELADGGHAWSNPSYITAKDEQYATADDVDAENEAQLKSLVAKFPAITAPSGAETFYVSIRCKYKWVGGQDYRWNKINRLQFYYNGWIGNNYGDSSIYQARSGEYDNIIATGDFGIEGGITRAMLESGNLGFGFNFQTGNNGHWYVDYAEIRVFGFIPSPGDGADKFELYVGTTAGLHRFKYNSSSAVSRIETWYDTKRVSAVGWDSYNVSYVYSDSGGSNPKVGLINIPAVNADEKILLAPTACEPGSAVISDAYNNIYVAVDKDVSDSGLGEIVCYDGVTGSELSRAVISDTVGHDFPSGVCVDKYRVYTSDSLGAYASTWSFLTKTLEPSGKISGTFSGNSYTYGNCFSIRRCDKFIVASTAASLVSPDENEFKGIWLYRIDAPWLPSINHYSMSRGALDGVYSYGITYYNEKDGTESEMFVMVYEASITKGFFDLNNIPQPSDTQVTHIWLYRLGGALSVFTKVAELKVGTTSYRDLTPDGEADGAYTEYGQYGPPLDMRNIRQLFGTFYGTKGTKLYYTTQANPNYWTTAPIDLDGTATGIEVCGQGLLAFTMNRTYFLSGASVDNYRLYPLYGDQGCVSPQSIQKYGDSVLWISNDGLCISNGGKPKLLSKEQLGKIGFTGIKASAFYDEVYYLAHEDGMFIADFRYNNSVKFRSLSDTDIDGMGVFDDTLYFHKDGTGDDAAGLYVAFDGTANRRASWKTGKRLLIDPGMVKYYKHTKLWYRGRPTITMLVDGEQAGNKLVLDKAEENTMIDIDLPHVTSGRFIQYLFEGDYELHYLEEIIDLNKR